MHSQMMLSSPRHLLTAVCLSGLLTTAAAKPIQPLSVLDEISEAAESDQALEGAGEPQMPEDFPDPTIVQDAESGDWYSFATNGNGKNVQMARAPEPLGPWEWINEDAMPDLSWTTGRHTWAPDVRRLADDSYILYFSGQVPDEDGKHCIGIATSPNVTGPYEPQSEPWACPLENGGAIDAAGFFDDSTGRRYVSYKIDGNHVGNGGDCGNSNEPLVPTPIMLQEVDPDDGFTKIGDPVEILDRTEADGPLVEAPDIIRVSIGGDDDEDTSVYIIFFSSHCFSSSQYNVNYAVSTEGVRGPYQRADRPLLETGDYGLEGPGGATSVEGGGEILFHARCDDGRCLHATRLSGLGGSNEVSDSEESASASSSSASSSESSSPTSSSESSIVAEASATSVPALSSDLPEADATSSLIPEASSSLDPAEPQGSGFREDAELDSGSAAEEEEGEPEEGQEEGGEEEGAEGEGSEAEEGFEEANGIEGIQSAGALSRFDGMGWVGSTGFTVMALAMAINGVGA